MRFYNRLPLQDQHAYTHSLLTPGVLAKYNHCQIQLKPGQHIFLSINKELRKTNLFDCALLAHVDWTLKTTKCAYSAEWAGSPPHPQGDPRSSAPCLSAGTFSVYTYLFRPYRRFSHPTNIDKKTGLGLYFGPSRKISTDLCCPWSTKPNYWTPFYRRLMVLAVVNSLVLAVESAMLVFFPFSFLRPIWVTRHQAPAGKDFPLGREQAQLPVNPPEKGEVRKVWYYSRRWFLVVCCHALQAGCFRLVILGRPVSEQ